MLLQDRGVGWPVDAQTPGQVLAVADHVASQVQGLDTPRRCEPGLEVAGGIGRARGLAQTARHECSKLDVVRKAGPDCGEVAICDRLYKLPADFVQ